MRIKFKISHSSNNELPRCTVGFEKAFRNMNIVNYFRQTYSLLYKIEQVIRSNNASWGINSRLLATLNVWIYVWTFPRRGRLDDVRNYVINLPNIVTVLGTYRHVWVKDTSCCFQLQQFYSMALGFWMSWPESEKPRRFSDYPDIR